MMSRTSHSSTRRSAGFTLVEMLAVIGIMAALLAFVAPSIGNLSASMQLTGAGQAISDQMNLARRLAMSNRRNLEVRFFKKTDGSGYDAYQLWQYDDQANEAKPLRRVERLHDAVTISESLSNLLSAAPAAQQGVVSMGTANTQRHYSAVLYRADGRLDLSLPLAESIITLVPLHASPTEPSNFYTLQISPMTGRIAALRP